MEQARPFLLVLAIALGASFAGRELARRYRMGAFALLVALGAVIGAVAPAARGPLGPILAALGPLALVILLFEGALKLDYRAIRTYAPRALAFTALAWALTAALATVSAAAALRLDLPRAALLGMALASTAFLALGPMLDAARPRPSTRAVLAIEGPVAGLLSGVGVSAGAAMILAGATPAEGARIVLSEVFLGACVGVLLGFGWARALHALEGRRGLFGLTLATVVAAFLLAETIGGNGYAMAVVAGLVLANARAISTAGKLDGITTLPPAVREAQDEASLLLTSVLPLCFGIALELGALHLRDFAAVALLVVAATVGRAFAAMTLPRGSDPDARPIALALMQRGLAAVVLAGVPAALGVPGTEQFATIAVLVVFGMDVLTTAGLLALERARALRDAPPGPLSRSPARLPPPPAPKPAPRPAAARATFNTRPALAARMRQRRGPT